MKKKALQLLCRICLPSVQRSVPVRRVANGSRAFQVRCRPVGGMTLKQLRLDAVTSSAAISACEKRWRLGDGSDLFNSMAQIAVESDTVTFNAAISACEKGSEWQMAV